MTIDLSADVVARLRARLRDVGYTVEGVRELLGPLAHAALHRNETTPGLVETAARTPLATLVRLWLLQAPVPRAQAATALPDLLEPLVAAGILHGAGQEVRALVDVRPYGAVGDVDDPTSRDADWWVLADLTPGMDGARPTVPPDHVLGVNSAAMTLAQLTVRSPVGRALDIGTGCGVQALHLTAHADHIVGTDVNARALAMTRLTAALNGIGVTGPDDDTGPAGPLELRAGSLFEPVDGETFDLIVSNPPFVISPRGGLTYRDSGMAGDEVCRQIVVEAPRHLSEGGVCQILANWLHVRGEDWRDRLAGWLARTGCDAWVVQREVSDPAEYVELWLKDAGRHGAAHYRERYEEWLAWFEAQNVEGIGFGWITLRRRTLPEDPGTPVRPGSSDTRPSPHVRIEEWTSAVVQPLGPEVARWLDAVDLLRAYDDKALLDARLELAPDVDQEQLGRPGAAHPEHVILRQRTGLCRAVRVDTAEAGFVGACDGSLTAGQIVDALATLLEEDADALPDRLLPRVREFVEEGYLSLSAAPG